MGKKDMLPVAGAKGWRLIGGTLASTLVACHCWGREGLGFLAKEGEESREAVADGSLVDLPYRWVLFIDQE